MRPTACLLAVLCASMVCACGSNGEPTGQGGSATTTTPSSTGSSTSTGAMGGAGTGGGGGMATGGAGGAMPATPPAFGAPITLSDPANAAFVPAIAARAGQCLVAWHEFVSGQARVVYTLVTDGAPGPTVVVPEPFAGGKNPWLAVTKGGYVLAYQANDGQTDVARAVEIDAAGAVIAGPDTVSQPGKSAALVRVATAGDQEAFAWTDGSAHSFALRGPETTSPAEVGTTLLATGLLNYPRIALDGSGNLFLAYRDGGAETSDWDVLLVVRPPRGAFGPPVNVSKTTGLLSDDIGLAVEADGTLDIAWVDQDLFHSDAFEVAHSTRAPGGAITVPTFYGHQGLWAWTPSVVPGLAAAWRTGVGSNGPMYFATATLPPTPILGSEVGARVVLAQGPDSRYHLAYYTGGPGSLVRYVRSE